MELLEILKSLDTPAIVLVLGYFLYRGDEKLKEKEQDNKDLNEYIRDSDKENIRTLSEFSKFLETLIANVDSIKGDLAREILYSAESVKERIDTLKHTIENKNGN
tara:strand:+ start:376 stop:690 length:315 start_codon:yes stop_codon:yes gene_type:complete